MLVAVALILDGYPGWSLFTFLSHILLAIAGESEGTLLGTLDGSFSVFRGDSPFKVAGLLALSAQRPSPLLYD